MHYFLSSIISILVIGALVVNISFVAGGIIPSRPLEELRGREATGGAISVAGLDVLRTYVCLPGANDVRRQTNRVPNDAVTIDIPVGEVAKLWQEIHWILEQLGAILETEGLLPGTALASDSSSTNANLPLSASLMTFLPSASIGTGNHLPTEPIVITTSLAAPTVSISSPGATISMNFPEVAVGTPGLAATPPQVSEAGTPTNSPLLQETSSLNIAPMTQGPACYATETIDETTTLSRVIVMATENVAAVSTAARTIVEDNGTLASAVATSTASAAISANGGIFMATSIEIGPLKSTGTSPYVFNSQSEQNIAVYFGQTPATGATTLAAQCADPNIDIVILAFVITNNFQGRYPSVNFGAACGRQTSKMIAEAPGLLSCPELEGCITECQQTYGKKVLLSIGGATSSLSFNAASEASDFAKILWQLFGPAGNVDPELRPFGNASIDGFDVDNEDNLPANYETLASTLRKNYDSDPNKTYYLSSAPQCPFPDASNPLTMLLLCDFVFVQFYNNAPCEIGSANFAASLQEWSTALQESKLSPKPRLYLGAPAWSAAGPSAYANIGSPEGIQGIAKDVKKYEVGEFWWYDALGWARGTFEYGGGEGYSWLGEGGIGRVIDGGENEWVWKFENGKEV